MTNVILEEEKDSFHVLKKKMVPTYSGPQFLANENLLPSLQTFHFCAGCSGAVSVFCLTKGPKCGWVKHNSEGTQEPGEVQNTVS